MDSKKNLKRLGAVASLQEILSKKKQCLQETAVAIPKIDVLRQAQLIPKGGPPSSGQDVHSEEDISVDDTEDVSSEDLPKEPLGKRLQDRRVPRKLLREVDEDEQLEGSRSELGSRLLKLSDLLFDVGDAVLQLSYSWQQD